MTQRASSVRALFLTYGVLLALLAATLATWAAGLGTASFAISLAIAAAKAALVVIVFMGARHSRPVTWFLFASGALWLAILIGLTMADVATRTPPIVR